MSNQYEIKIFSDFQDTLELKKVLEQELQEQELSLEPVPPINLRLRRAPSEERGIETAILVAIITGGFGLLVALINALAKIYEKKGVIKIRTSKGDEIEFPADISEEKIEELLKLHRKLGVERISVIQLLSGDQLESTLR